jgi:hypothetical protein
MIQKMLANFGWKRPRVNGEERIVERFLWWPRTLNSEFPKMETRCWCRAKIVQRYHFWTSGGKFEGGWYDARWADAPANTNAQD